MSKRKKENLINSQWNQVFALSTQIHTQKQDRGRVCSGVCLACVIVNVFCKSHLQEDISKGCLALTSSQNQGVPLTARLTNCEA